MEFKLIVKKLTDSLSEEEEITFSEWYNESDEHKEYFKKVSKNYHNESFPIDIEKGWKSIQKQITPVRKVPQSGYFKYAVAASIILLLSIPLLLKKDKVEPMSTPIVTTSKTIKIGTDRSTLTLEDGTNVDLEKGQQYLSSNVESDGEKIVYTAPSSTTEEVVYNYLTIPRGGQYHAVLSDGTEVWLNSESQIKFPVSFPKNAARQVELVYGEAYFDVSPSTDHQGAAFKVITESQEIEVLGTEFNISAYKNEDAIYTTLIEGTVAVHNGKAKTILKPNQQSIIVKQSEGIEVANADVFSVTSWRKGIFSFDESPLENIMNVLARWYDVEIVFSDPTLKTEHFSGILRKNQDIVDILNSIQVINNNAYVIKNNTIIFK